MRCGCWTIWGIVFRIHGSEMGFWNVTPVVTTLLSAAFFDSLSRFERQFANT